MFELHGDDHHDGPASAALPAEPAEPLAASAARWLALCQGLCGLGPVLCLYDDAAQVASVRLAPGAPLPWQRELVGLLGARRLQPVASLDNEGPQEGLWFLDADGRPRFGLCLLPDSDYLAWERFLATLPVWPAVGGAGAGWCERLFARLQRRLQAGPDWYAGLRRFRLGAAAGLPVLALEPVPTLSPASRLRARDLAGRSHARLDPHADDCCCARAAKTARH